MPGFAFWGLFLVFGLIVVLYTVWMFVVEAREARQLRESEVRDANDADGEGTHAPGGRP